MALLPEEFPGATAERNFRHYEPRCAHGRSRRPGGGGGAGPAGIPFGGGPVGGRGGGGGRRKGGSPVPPENWTGGLPVGWGGGVTPPAVPARTLQAASRARGIFSAMARIWW